MVPANCEIRRLDLRNKLLTKYLALVILLDVAITPTFVFAQASATSPSQHQARPTPPTRDPHTPGYVHAKELPDGTVPPASADGNFIIGPTHPAAPGMSSSEKFDRYSGTWV